MATDPDDCSPYGEERELRVLQSISHVMWHVEAECDPIPLSVPPTS